MADAVYGVYLKGIPIEAVPNLNDYALSSSELSLQVATFDMARGPGTPLLGEGVLTQRPTSPHPALRKFLIDSLVQSLGEDGAEEPPDAGASRESLVAELDIALAKRAVDEYRLGPATVEPPEVWSADESDSWQPPTVAMVARPIPSWYGPVLATRLGFPDPDVTGPEGGPSALPGSSTGAFEYIRESSSAMRGLVPQEILNYGPGGKIDISELVLAGSDIGDVYEEAPATDPRAAPSFQEDDRAIEALIGKLSSDAGEVPEWNSRRLQRDLELLYARGLSESIPTPASPSVRVLGPDNVFQFLEENDLMVRHDWKRMPG